MFCPWASMLHSMQAEQGTQVHIVLLQIAFMQTLMAEGVADKSDIVFLDMDVLVVDSLAEVCKALFFILTSWALIAVQYMALRIRDGPTGQNVQA